MNPWPADFLGYPGLAALVIFPAAASLIVVPCLSASTSLTGDAKSIWELANKVTKIEEDIMTSYLYTVIITITYSGFLSVKAPCV